MCKPHILPLLVFKYKHPPPTPQVILIIFRYEVILFLPILQTKFYHSYQLLSPLQGDLSFKFAVFRTYRVIRKVKTLVCISVDITHYVDNSKQDEIRL